MKAFLAIVVSALILFVNLGLTIHSHYCNGKLIASTLSSSEVAVSCSMESELSNDGHSNEDHSLHEENCCENEFTKIQIEGKNDIVIVEPSKTEFRTIVAFLYSSTDLSSVIPTNKLTYSSFLSPNYSYDMRVKNQLFLI